MRRQVERPFPGGTRRSTIQSSHEDQSLSLSVRFSLTEADRVSHRNRRIRLAPSMDDFHWTALRCIALKSREKRPPPLPPGGLTGGETRNERGRGGAEGGRERKKSRKKTDDDHRASKTGQTSAVTGGGRGIGFRHQQLVAEIRRRCFGEGAGTKERALTSRGKFPPRDVINPHGSSQWR